MFTLDAESLAMASTLAGIVTSVTVFLWKKLLKPAIRLMDDHEEIKKSIDIIKGEVTPNGGGSLKDAVNSLKQTCKNIETTQKVLDQRSKASLHYHDRALFEVDKLGGMQWFNERFESLTEDNGTPTEGFDWVSIVDESEREDFVKEVTSCLEMCRKIDIETKSVHNQTIHFLGYPYRIADKDHEGFLIHLYKEN
tara:strand:+ start:228 stop:812 length:585 start_codon:yes stop_codon:yes gene_type:complete